MAFTLSIAVLGLAGLPPFAGFMSKWQIFAAGFETQNIAIDLLVIFAALNSVLSLAYYAPIVNAVYRQEPSEAVTRGQAVSMDDEHAADGAGRGDCRSSACGRACWRGLTGPAGVALVKAFGGIMQTMKHADMHGCSALTSDFALADSRYKDDNMQVILTPPVAFVLYFALVAILFGFGRVLAGKGKPSEEKSSTYASGEASPLARSLPGYRGFFVIALFFAVLHLGVLMLGSSGASRRLRWCI